MQGLSSCILALLAVLGCAAAQVTCTADALAPHDVQGPKHESQLEGQTVTVEGVVSRVDGERLYVQTLHKQEDSDPSTSEGLLLFWNDNDFSSIDGVATGAKVVAMGEVQEFGFNDDLRTTEVVISAADDVVACGSKQRPAKPVIISANRKNKNARTPPADAVYKGTLDLGACGDSCPDLKPSINGLDFWESLEGNLICVRNPLVVGADGFGDFYIVPDKGRVDFSGINARGGVTNDPGDNDFNPEVVKVETPSSPEAIEQPEIGDSIEGRLCGVLDYNFGVFSVFLTETPDIERGDPDLKREGPTALTAADNELTIATYNILNFPGEGGAEADARLDKIAEHIAVNMKCPCVVALQEQQDNNGETNDAVVAGNVVGARIAAAAEAAGCGTYEWTDIPPVDDQDGGVPGGNIRVAYLYRPACVALAAPDAAGGSREATTVAGDADGDVQLSANPGRIDPCNSAFDNSRKPLAAEFVLKATGETFFTINVHFASKGGSSALFGGVQPPVNGGEDDRVAQAAAVNDFVDEILCRDPAANVVVLGDLNEFTPFAPLVELREGGILVDLLYEKLPQEEIYTFNFQGRSQALDHIFVTPNLAADSEVDIVHVNSGLVEQAADHDPIYAVLSSGGGTTNPAECGAAYEPATCEATGGGGDGDDGGGGDGGDGGDNGEPPATGELCAQSRGFFINELHYDNDGTDQGEFIEVAGPADAVPTTLAIVLYNGNGGAVYDTDAVPAYDATASGQGFAAISYPTNGIQNGEADGIALVDTANGGCVIEFISYEGTLVATDGPASGLESSDIGVAESGSTPIGASLGRADAADSAFAVLDAATPGAPNSGSS